MSYWHEIAATHQAIAAEPTFSLTPENISSKILSGDLSSRTGLATQINADGSIGWCPNNLCVDTVGLTTGWGNTRSTLQKNVGVDPDGYPFHKLVEDTTVGEDHRISSTAATTQVGVTYKTSLMVKGAGRNGLSIWTNHFNTRHAEINLIDGSVWSSGFDVGMLTVTNRGDGWWRVDIRQVAAAAQSSIALYFATTDSSGAYLYTGDGSSGIYFSQPIFSAGEQPYYPTNGAAFYGVRTDDYSTGVKKTLVEPQATNLIRWGDNLANSNDWGASIATDASILYRGRKTWNITKKTTNGSEAIGISVSPAGAASVVRLHLFAGTSDKVQIGLYSTSFAPLTARIVSGPGQQSVGSATVNLTSLSSTVPTIVDITFVSAPNGVFLLYPGLASSTVVGKGIRVQVDNFEVGAVATSYIPTSGAAVTRTADVTAFSRGTLATQVNQDGSIGWCPHNLITKSEGVVPVAGGNAPPVITTELDPTTGVTCSVATFAAHTLAGYAEGNSVWEASKAVVTAGQKYVYEAEVWTSAANMNSVQFYLQSVSTTPGSDVYWVTGSSPTDQWWKLRFYFTPDSSSSNVMLVAYRSSTPVTSTTTVKVRRQSLTAVMKAPVGFTQVSSGYITPYFKTTGAPYYGLRDADYSDGVEPVYGPPLALQPGIPSGASAVVSDGVYRLYSVSGEYTNISFGSILTVGKTYEIAFRVVSVTTPGSGINTDSVSAAMNAPASVGTQRMVICAAYAVATLKRGGGACDLTIDSVQIREITGYAGRSGGGGIKVEPQAANLIAWSDDLTKWDTGISMASSTETYRGLPVWSLNKTLASNSQGLGKFMSLSPGTFTLRIHLFADTSDKLQIGLHNGAFLPVTATRVQGPGSITTTSNTVVVTGLSVTVPTVVDAVFTASATGSATLLIYPDTVSSTTIGAGNRVQLDNFEAGSVATSRIPTSGSAVTRGADVLTVPVAQIAGWNNSRGAFLIDGLAVSSDANTGFIGIEGANAAYLYRNSGLDKAYQGFGLTVDVANVYANGSRIKRAVSWSQGQATVSAVDKVSSGVFSPTAPSSLRIGMAVNGFADRPVSFYKLSYYPKALSAAKLKALTS